MPDISISDNVSLSASVQVSDDSPLAAANLKSLKFSKLSPVTEFGKPLDHAGLNEVDFGIDLTAPSALVGNGAELGIGAGLGGTFSITIPKQPTLFEDEFAPEIEIGPSECWAGLSLDLRLQKSLGLSSGGVGIQVKVGTDIEFSTFVRFPSAGSPMPTLKEGLTAVLQNYSIPYTPEKIRGTPAGIAYAMEATGTISFGASYAAPIDFNPLATLGLPLNLAIRIAPSADASIKGSIALEGDFIVRAYRSSDTKLILGVYKKHKTTLTATLSESAGVAVDVNKTDVLSGVLKAVLPAADLDDLRLDDSQKEELRKALKECVDQSISIALNTSCAASVADEAAVVYELDLTVADLSQTDSAIASALRGDWSHFEALPNARSVRNIVRKLHDRNHKFTFNLLGLYNATSIGDYLNSTTVVHDEHGQIAIVDKAAAQTLSAGTTPYAAKSDKLRSALAQAFVATVAYGASAGKIVMSSFSVRQSLLEYRAQANCSDLTREILLARSVGLATNAEWDTIAKSGATFSQNKLYLDTRYDLRSVMHLFYQDVEKRVPYAPAAVDRMGRDTKIALLDPSATNSMQRRAALCNDEIWNAMNSDGNVTRFKQIPGIAKLDPTAIASIGADWSDIRWWSDALQSLTPHLTAVLESLDNSHSSDPLTDGVFMTAHKGLEKALSHLSSKTQSAFGDGWGLAVMYRLATSGGAVDSAPSVQMDIGWNKKFEHYESGSQIAIGQSGGA